jgi:sigma-B regulation protein RsbU (phosphoserine phosphatase)
LVLLLTDGIFEATSPAGELFGMERVFDVIRRGRHGSAREIVEQLHAAAREFCRGRPQQDDITAVVVKVLGTS